MARVRSTKHARFVSVSHSALSCANEGFYMKNIVIFQMKLWANVILF